MFIIEEGESTLKMILCQNLTTLVRQVPYFSFVLFIALLVLGLVMLPKTKFLDFYLTLSPL